MQIELRGLKVGQDRLGGWVFSLYEFNGVSNMTNGSTVDVGQFAESTGFLSSLIWFR